MRLPLWAVLTPIIRTPMSVGRSSKATIDYLAGTIGGAIYGVRGVLAGHDSAKSRCLRGSPSHWGRLR